VGAINNAGGTGSGLPPVQMLAVQPGWEDVVVPAAASPSRGQQRPPAPMATEAVTPGGRAQQQQQEEGAVVETAATPPQAVRFRVADSCTAPRQSRPASASSSTAAAAAAAEPMTPIRGGERPLGITTTVEASPAGAAMAPAPGSGDGDTAAAREAREGEWRGLLRQVSRETALHCTALHCTALHCGRAPPSRPAINSSLR
jgi:hypothetical protein